jgi:hypothetical protein
LYDADSGETRRVLDAGIYGVEYSPDDGWIAFDRNGQVFIAPFGGRMAPTEKEWIAVSKQGKSANWADDGSLLYFLSWRDGFTCIWAQRLDPSSKKPAGESFPVYHSHSSRRSLSNVTAFDQGISVAGRRIAFVLGEQTGNIWMAKSEEQK